jgi:hypothetical protein
MVRNAANPHAATRSPDAPPANDTTMLSVSICWTTRERVAPTARRTDSSFWRLAARARSSVATFAQAMNITNTTAPSSTSSAGRTSPTNASRSGRRFGAWFAFSAG